jgi:uncharacterized protein (DUF2267 family)
MDMIDPGNAYTKTIILVQELFDNLPPEEADKLQEELMDIYFDENPEELQKIIIVAGDDFDLLQVKKELFFNQKLNEDYGFNVEILRERRNDEIAEVLVDKIDEYNSKVKLT